MGHVALRGVRLAIEKRTLLGKVDLEVQPGELVAVLGPNGVGKTTLLRTIAGFVKPGAGEVLLDGAPLVRLSQRERARGITLLGEEVALPQMSVREVVATGRFARRAWWRWSDDASGRQAVDAALRQVELAELAERQFDTLSSGERQRARLALALAQEAGVILVDEPTSHLDVRFAFQILNLLRALARGPRSVVAVLHDLNEAAAVADRIVLLGDRAVLADAPPADALAPELLERAFGVAFTRLDADGVVRVMPRAPATYTWS
ncbi:MAG TPA: ABC transporter ATP-binding protein [Candidatus Baltobacteraceae bacterium]|nr:ABC transporter ATP-binding protein [Candidatus Baltobacteraceae bacterium]